MASKKATDLKKWAANQKNPLSGHATQLAAVRKADEHSQKVQQLFDHAERQPSTEAWREAADGAEVLADQYEEAGTSGTAGHWRQEAKRARDQQAGHAAGAGAIGGYLAAARKYSDAKKRKASTAELAILEKRMSAEWFTLDGKSQTIALREAKKAGYDVS